MSKDMKHTPGPWHIVWGRETGRPRGIRANGRTIISWGGIAQPATRESQGNAVLMAAAPDMLAALKEISQLPAFHQEKSKIVAAEAISKAEGRS